MNGPANDRTNESIEPSLISIEPVEGTVTMALTDEQDKHLTGERAKGIRVRTIAGTMGKTENDVKHRLWRLANRKSLQVPILPE